MSEQSVRPLPLWLATALKKLAALEVAHHTPPQEIVLESVDGRPLYVSGWIVGVTGDGSKSYVLPLYTGGRGRPPVRLQGTEVYEVRHERIERALTLEELAKAYEAGVVLLTPQGRIAISAPTASWCFFEGTIKTPDGEYRLERTQTSTPPPVPSRGYDPKAARERFLDALDAWLAERGDTLEHLEGPPLRFLTREGIEVWIEPPSRLCLRLGEEREACWEVRLPDPYWPAPAAFFAFLDELLRRQRSRRR